ncbi:hypothetical protein AMJ71_09890 [candidate division TA06 bacterium SM1_40]|uniref:Uncharacterized protein n=2 Tax=Bacteria division TA06 TaxID=1156500 RepID=A0A0S8JAI9_UNCT6|nr:MAG: hypothetical protein AMJ82_04030 [candidate division TA06 bacterium SM23_40]KPL06371.1 MAG: hypothetical protein AMJ71_09890 [candidate division TA06 bacterium SM1_40]
MTAQKNLTTSGQILGAGLLVALLALCSPVGAQPLLRVCPTQFDVTVSEEDTVAEMMLVANDGYDVLTFDITPDVTWAWDEPSSGTLYPGDSTFVTVYFSSVGLTPGEHWGFNFIDHNDPFHPHPWPIPKHFVFVVRTITMITGVPDENQPPAGLFPQGGVFTNFCAPTAAANIVSFWDEYRVNPGAIKVLNCWQPCYAIGRINDCAKRKEAADYIGWFMDTNNQGDPVRMNGTVFPAAMGTFNGDVGPGLTNFVSWEGTYPNLPDTAGVCKQGYNWTVTPFYGPDPEQAWEFYKAEIDSGRPLLTSFLYWNPVPEGKRQKATDAASLWEDEWVDYYTWGNAVNASGAPDPVEQWNWYEEEQGIGHMVTGVGYATDNLGNRWAIVHDNWPTTPRNIAIPWANWAANFRVLPDVTPNVHCVVSPMQRSVPKGATLDFSVGYHNNTQAAQNFRIKIMAYLPGSTNPAKTYATGGGNPDPTLQAGTSMTRYYALDVPNIPQVQPVSGYVIKVAVYQPPQALNPIASDCFCFSVTQPMSSMPLNGPEWAIRPLGM